MPIPKMPARAWVQIASIVAMFFFALWISLQLWHAGARTPASLLLIFYAAVTILYSLWLRFRQQLR
jgi:hypothetical protein